MPEIPNEINLDLDAIRRGYAEYYARQARARAKEVEQILQNWYPNYDKDTENANFYEEARKSIDKYLPLRYYPPSYCP